MKNKTFGFFVWKQFPSCIDNNCIQVVRSNFALASKLLFKLARDDANDHQFLTRKTLELYLSIGLGRNCPFSDNDAFVYGYGALKFLTLNNKVSKISFSQYYYNRFHLSRYCTNNPFYLF